MLILIYGEDTYRSLVWRRELEEKFRAKFDLAGYNLVRFDETIEFNELRTALLCAPFLSSRRMVIISRLLEKHGRQKNYEEMLSHLPESTICLLWEEGNEKTLDQIVFFAKLRHQKAVKAYYFPLLQGEALEDWAAAAARKLDLVFERGARRALVVRVGPDLWQMASELEKMAALGQPVTIDWVRDNVRGVNEENIFNFIDALSVKNSSRAVQELKNEYENGASVFYLLSMLTRQFRLLREAQNYALNHPRSTAADLVEVFGWHPFVAKKVMSQIKLFPENQLANIVDRIFSTEQAIKTGQLEATSALGLLVAEVVK